MPPNLPQSEPGSAKFAVLGNHEYYAGLDRSLAFTKAAGFDLLRDDVGTQPV
jgi:hypothetical protein